MLPSVAQPPLPLHEFFPLQPLSLVLHPPLPLQEFFPWQACLSAFVLPINETPGFPVETEAWVVAANEPLINPAIAAPATIVFFVMLTFLFFGFARPRDGTLPSGADQMVGNPWLIEGSRPLHRGWITDSSIPIKLPLRDWSPVCTATPGRTLSLTTAGQSLPLLSQT